MKVVEKLNRKNLESIEGDDLEQNIKNKTDKLLEGEDKRTAEGIKNFISGFEQKIKDVYYDKKTTETEKKRKIKEIVEKYKKRIDDYWSTTSYYYCLPTVINSEKREIAKNLLSDIKELLLDEKRKEHEKDETN